MSNISFQKVLGIEPASQCNLDCSHCPTGSVDMDRGVMSESIFNLILNQIKNNIDSIEIVVLYHVAEPLRNSLFYEIVAKFKDIKPSIFFKSVTNGTTSNQSNAIRLVKSRRKLFAIPVIQSSTS